MTKEEKLFDLLELLSEHLELFNDSDLQGLKDQIEDLLMLKAAKEFLHLYGIV